jgi:hypothetical protein
MGDENCQKTTESDEKRLDFLEFTSYSAEEGVCHGSAAASGLRGGY